MVRNLALFLVWLGNKLASKLRTGPQKLTSKNAILFQQSTSFPIVESMSQFQTNKLHNFYLRFDTNAATL